VLPRSRTHSSYADASVSRLLLGSASPLNLRAFNSASSAVASLLEGTVVERILPLASRQRTRQRVPSAVSYRWTLKGASQPS